MANGYQDEQFSDQQLKAGYWYVRNKKLLRNITIGLLVFINVIFWSFTLYRLIDLYIISYDEYQAVLNELPQDLTNIRQYTVENQPTSLQILGLSVVPGNEQTFDVGAKVYNPNERWFATFTYQFFAPGLESKEYKDFVLPGDEKFLLDLSVSSQGTPTQPRLEFRDLKWERIQDYESIKNEALRIDVDDITFASARSTGLTGDELVSRSSFTASNNSPFDYRKVKFISLLYSGNQIVGLNSLTQENFLSGQSRDITQNWFGVLPSANRIEVFVDVNILDEDVYLN